MWGPYLPSQYECAYYHSECSDELLLLKRLRALCMCVCVCVHARVCMSMCKIVLREACHNILKHSHNLRWFSAQAFKRKIQILQTRPGIVRLHYNFLAYICRSTISHSSHGFQCEQCLFSACESEITWIYHSMTSIQSIIMRGPFEVQKANKIGLI